MRFRLLILAGLVFFTLLSLRLLALFILPGLFTAERIERLFQVFLSRFTFALFLFLLSLFKLFFRLFGRLCKILLPHLLRFLLQFFRRFLRLIRHLLSGLTVLVLLILPILLALLVLFILLALLVLLILLALLVLFILLALLVLFILLLLFLRLLIFFFLLIFCLLCLLLSLLLHFFQFFDFLFELFGTFSVGEKNRLVFCKLIALCGFAHGIKIHSLRLIQRFQRVFDLFLRFIKVLSLNRLK